MRVSRYLGRLAEVTRAVAPTEIAAAVTMLEQAWAEDRLVLTCGNGGSASAASHLALDLSKQTMVAGRPALRALALTDPALMSAWANDAGYREVFAEQVRLHGRPGDLLVCLSCSGTSENVVAAIAAARQGGLAILVLGGTEGSLPRRLADVYVHVPSFDYGEIEAVHVAIQHCIATLLREAAELGALTPVTPGRPVVLLDRDGVINRNLPGSVRSWDAFEFLPGVLEALAMLRRGGHRVIVVTNQASVARGQMTPAQLEDIHRRMQAAILEAGGEVEAVMVCAHAPEAACECRKPQPGLITEAARRHRFRAGEAIMVGDHRDDMAAAAAAGTRRVLVLSGREAGTPPGELPPADLVAPDLLAATRKILDGHFQTGLGRLLEA